MTNREVLKKFILQTFNIEVNDEFTIKCYQMNCTGSKKCSECPGTISNGFWDEEFVEDENVQINNNANERVAIREISW